MVPVRLLELAREAALRRHIQGLMEGRRDHTEPERATLFEEGFLTCPHVDCSLVRAQQEQRTQVVTRFEVIDEGGRVMVRRPCEIELSFQDQGRTLKVFVTGGRVFQPPPPPSSEAAIETFCSSCHDELTDGSVYGITPQRTCGACGRLCLGYGGIRKTSLAALPSQEARPQDLRVRAESLYEEIGGDLCICQRANVPHWCETCQQRIDTIVSAFRRLALAAVPPQDATPRDVHQQIMNIRCVPPANEDARTVAGYRLGHRDARHAAAEVSLPTADEVRGILKPAAPQDEPPLPTIEQASGLIDNLRGGLSMREFIERDVSQDEPPQGWRDIASAPKMQTIILFAATDGAVRNWKMATGFWHTGYDNECSKSEGYTPWTWDGEQLKSYQIQPTDWMPLPAPPAPRTTPPDTETP